MNQRNPAELRCHCPPKGLSILPAVGLDPTRQRMLEMSCANSGGSASWRGRKRAEARDLLALSQIAPPGRMKVEFIDLREDLKAAVGLRVPVPCLAEPQGELKVLPRALLGITYPQEALRASLPGYAFVQVLTPHHVWHANVAPDGVQPLCLGARLPAGIQAKELVLLSYAALTLQSVMFDERDGAGVMNPAAARWWQQNLDRIPLTRTPFLGVDGGSGRDPSRAAKEG